MYTIVSAIMKRYTTTDELFAEFEEKRMNLAKQGWIPHGDIIYYVNGLAQAMVQGAAPASDLERVFLHGSKTPLLLKFCIGGEGFMGKYVDICRT